MEDNAIKYVGRCDACGRNLYEHDVYAEIYYGSGIMVCENCFKVCCGNRKRDIYSLIPIKKTEVQFHEPQIRTVKTREKFRTKAEAEAFIRSILDGGIPISCNNKEIGRVTDYNYISVDPFDGQFVVEVICILRDFTMPAVPVYSYEIEFVE